MSEKPNQESVEYDMTCPEAIGGILQTAERVRLRLLRAQVRYQEGEINELREAIDAGGMEIYQCKGCGKPVVAIPDGLPMCEKCAEENV